MRAATFPRLWLAFLLAAGGAANGAAPTTRWAVHEITLTGDRDYANPPWDVSVTVEFTGPAGRKLAVEAFWDGGRTWRARFSPDEAGPWRWRTRCSDPADAGLHEKSGDFECAAYSGDNPLYLHGPVRLSEDRRRFVHADGTPFFWLADTAWNGALRSREEDWAKYLATRQRQRFTAVQFVCTQWRGGSKTLAEHAFSGAGPITLNPNFFQRLDARVAAVNAHGLLAAPVLLWALTEPDPGRALSEKDAVRLARYMTARWGAHQVVWFLGGDGHYTGQDAPRWRNLGRGVFGDRHDRLATLHPCGLSWVADDFAEEAWFDFIGYQSGHGDGAKHVGWLILGPPAQQWKKTPVRPIVNLEPNYEGHPAYQTARPHSPQHVRRAAYWSLLVAPPAGVTYGTNSIWNWSDKPGPAEGHERLGTIPPWPAGLETEGIASMTVLRAFFESGPWTALLPAPEVLAEQPGTAKNPERFIAAAATEDRSWAVVYLPEGGKIKLKGGVLKGPASARWFDPRTGQQREAGALADSGGVFTAPDSRDWVLDIRTDRPVR